MTPTLYLTSVPIGNQGDMSQRAIETIKKADLIIGEEFKTTSKVLKFAGALPNEFELLNEHSDNETIESLLKKIKSKTNTCLFSDAGTPLLADPGQNLVKRAIQEGITIRVVPGASAFLVALLLSGIPVSPFTFVGFLPRESNDRMREVRKYVNYRHTLVFYETPYRYKKAFLEILDLFPKKTQIFLGLDLTTDLEFQFRGTRDELQKRMEGLPKGNPVLVVDNS